jgi:hypothetical protein
MIVVVVVVVGVGARGRGFCPQAAGDKCRGGIIERVTTE